MPTLRFALLFTAAGLAFDLAWHAAKGMEVPGWVHIPLLIGIALIPLGAFTTWRHRTRHRGASFK